MNFNFWLLFEAGCGMSALISNFILCFKISMHHAWWFALSLLSLVIVVCIIYSKVNTKSRQTSMQQSVEAYTHIPIS
jgi:H+/Cl- antiporter ClcA